MIPLPTWARPSPTPSPWSTTDPPTPPASPSPTCSRPGPPSWRRPPRREPTTRPAAYGQSEPVTTTTRQSLTITAQVVSANPSANTASISHADQFDPNPANNTDTASVNPQHADLALLKTVSDSTPNVGDTITYTVTLVNNGPSTATSVEVSDPLPAGLTFVSDNASPGSYDPTTGAMDHRHRRQPPPNQCSPSRPTSFPPTPPTNTASIATADQFDPDPGNNTASATETPQQADLAVTKTVSNATPNVGDIITYTVGVNNHGPDAATNVTVTDLLPAGPDLRLRHPSQGTYDPTTGLWTVGTVTPPRPATLTIQAQVVSANAQTNTATISHADQFDPDTANNTATATETPQHADLALLKTVSDSTPNVGDTITYTVTARQQRTVHATSVTVTRPAPGRA